MNNTKRISVTLLLIFMVGFSLFGFIESFSKTMIYTIISLMGLSIFISFLIFHLGFGVNVRKRIFGK